MPKSFVYFLTFAQLLVIGLHVLVYLLAITFFPQLLPYRLWLGIILALLSISFLGLSFATYNRSVALLNAAYVFSSIWSVFVVYFLAASVIALLLYWVNILGMAPAGWLAVVASGVLAIYGVVNARLTRVTSIEVALPGLPEFWRGKTAVMVSDLHLGQVLRKGFARKIIKMVNRQNPEAVFIPGDFFDGVHTDFANLAAEFKNIKAPLGTYFCSGNHEMFAGYQKCESAIRNAGIKILENEKVELQGLQIAGVAYKSERMPDLQATLQNLNLEKNKPSILLKHVPLQLKEADDAGISLQLSGHSHHGQIWPGRHITKRYFKGFDYGLKACNNLQVYTSSGAGTWGPPMRVFTKAEIVKIKFV